MIIELVGPPAAGKSTLGRALGLALAERGIAVRKVDGARLAHHPPFTSEAGPEVRHPLSRVLTKISTATATLFADSREAEIASSLLNAIKPKSMLWSVRLRIDLVHLAQAWTEARGSDAVYVFEEGFVQALCSLALLTRDSAPDTVRACLALLPKPDLLVRLQVPKDALRPRLVARHEAQRLLGRLLDLHVEDSLKQADITDDVAALVHQANWPIMDVSNLDRQELADVVDRVVLKVLPGLERKAQDRKSQPGPFAHDATWLHPPPSASQAPRASQVNR